MLLRSLRQLFQGFAVLSEGILRALFPGLEFGNDGGVGAVQDGTHIFADVAETDVVAQVKGQSIEHDVQHLTGSGILHEAQGQGGIVVGGTDDLIAVVSHGLHDGTDNILAGGVTDGGRDTEGGHAVLNEGVVARLLAVELGHGDDAVGHVSQSGEVLLHRQEHGGSHEALLAGELVDNVVNKVAKNADAEPNAAIIIAMINAIKKPIKITHNELSVCSPRVPKRTSLTVFTTTLENGGRK